MNFVVVVRPLNDVVQILDSLGQAVAAPHRLTKFPSMEAFMAAQKAASFTGRADKRGTAHGAKDVHDEFVEVGPVGRDTLLNALANGLVGDFCDLSAG